MYYTKKPRRFHLRNPGSDVQNRSRMLEWMKQMELKNNQDIAALDAEIRRIKSSISMRLMRRK